MDDGFIQENYEHLEDAYYALELPEDFEEYDSEDDFQSDEDDQGRDEVENDANLSNKLSSKVKDSSKKKDLRVLGKFYAYENNIFSIRSCVRKSWKNILIRYGLVHLFHRSY